jgi:phage terminase large subunit GpA-like protein
VQIEQIFAESLAHFRPPPERSIEDWAAQYILIPGGHRRGRFDIDNAPWVRKPLADFKRTDCRELVTICAARSSKTTAAMTGLLWSIANDPGEALWVLPSNPLAGDFSEIALQKTIDACEPVASLLSDRTRSRFFFDFPGAPLTLSGAGAASRGQLAARTCRRVFIDEADKISVAAIEEACERTKTYWHAKVWYLGTPELIGGTLYSKWLESTQNIWLFDCLGCHEPLPLVWSSQHCSLLTEDLAKKSKMVWDDSAKLVNGTWDYVKAAASARLVCCKCGYEHRDIPTVRKHILRGDFVSLNPGGAIPGYHWNQLLPNWRNGEWGGLVAQFLQATDALKYGNAERLRKFVGQSLGEPWQEGQEIARGEAILSSYRIAETADLAGYDFRFLTVDVQSKSFWAVIRDWRKTGESRLVYEGELGTWGEIDRLAERFKITNPRHILLDAHFDEKEVFRQSIKRGWICLLGHDAREDFTHHLRGRKVFRPYSEPQMRDPGIGTAEAKQRYAILILWRSEPIRDQLDRLRTGRGPAWQLPADISDQYKKQLAAEQKIETRNKQTGRFESRWKTLNRMNHLFDCEAMQVVAATIAGILSYSPEPVLAS